MTSLRQQTTGAARELKRRAGEAGYTLLESLVAMSLFVAVLIPTVGLVGNLMFDRKPDQDRHALLAGETEMCRVIATQDFADGTNAEVPDFVLSRTVVKTDVLVEITVTVALKEAPRKTILVLHKSLLTHP